MSAPEFDWDMHSGDHKNLVVTVKNSAGAIVPLTGALEVKFQMSKKTDTGFSSTVALSKALSAGITEIELTDPVNGVMAIKFVPADTGALKGEYYYEIEVEDATNNVATVLIGTLTILKDLVTNP